MSNTEKENETMDFINHYILYPFWRTSFGRMLHRWLEWCKIMYYTRCIQPRIEQRLHGQHKLNIVFFVISVSMWKADRLVKHLMRDSHYDVHIVSFLYPQDSIERRKELQDQMETFFKQKNYPYINSYDFQTNTYFNVHSLHPDIIFYNQPYNIGYPGYRLERFWKTSLFAYIPYCVNIEQNDVFYDTLYLNVCKYVFLSTKLDISLMQSKTKVKGSNCIVVGSLLYDELQEAIAADELVWHHPEKKHIIWAPHHTISPQDVLQYSTFLSYADFMLNIANKYSDSIEIAFKPHPALKEKLYLHSDWGLERTNNYYTQWATMPNTFLADGSYATLFVQSDAMIHDCSTFSCEYLYTNKPVLFLDKDTNDVKLTDLGASCHDMHYHAYQASEIEEFINNVILDIDSLKGVRQDFIEHTLLTPDNTSTVTKIIQNLNKLIISQ